MMAGPCSVESRDQLFETADAVKAAGATILRGGAFKPRTSPYAFQGLGVEALRYLAEARDRTGLPIITEVMEPSQVDIVAEYADILQIGTRNMQNYSLLRDVGRVARPVMLKRGYGATVEEWLMAAEYIVSSGNPNVILCERGIRTFETYTRNTLDLAAVPLLHHLTHLPVIVDPSHATGKRWLVKPLAIGGVAVGADGVMVEVHPTPDQALSDAEQQLDLDQFRDLMETLVPVHGHVRGLHGVPIDPAAMGIGGSSGLGEALMSIDLDRDVAIVEQAHRLRGELRLPGDKSISHRALILATLAAGESRIDGAGDGADVRSTAAGHGCPRGDGRARRRRRATGRLSGRVAGRRWSAGARRCPRLREQRHESATHHRDARRPADDLHPDRRRFIASPSGRPYHRAAAPMGAVLHGRRDDSLPPLTVVGHTPLKAVDLTTTVPSAQVKSAILLAGLHADGATTVRERVVTRDHTERMLRARGVAVEREGDGAGGASWTVQGGGTVQAIDERVPGDISAATFWLVAGAIHPDAELVLRGVGVNPTRRAIIDILRRMGADIEERPVSSDAGAVVGSDAGVGEPIADVVVRSSDLRAIDLSPTDVAEAIDEIPALCLAAVRASGTTTIRGAGELRHKESDRIAGVVAGLRALGATIDVDGDDLRVVGGDTLVGASTDSLDDHRLAMTFAIAGLVATGRTSIERPASAGISYPGFFDDLQGVRA